MTTQDIQNYLSQNYPGYNLTPFEEYTSDDVQNATNIYINTDDCNWQLGYENEFDMTIEPDDYLEDLPIYFD